MNNKDARLPARAHGARARPVNESGSLVVTAGVSQLQDAGEQGNLGVQRTPSE